MKHPQIARLEAQLEQIIEGAFTNLFGKRIQAQDIALRLARVMEDSVMQSESGDPRPVAPDEFLIYMNPQVQKQLIDRSPNLTQALGIHLVELASASGYRFKESPVIRLLADATLAQHHFTVIAHHTNQNDASTAAMQRVPILQPTHATNAQIIIDGSRHFKLEQEIINIGRSPENELEVNDPYISRHHLQIRLRYGAYVLFDIRSRSGTLVNGVKVKEHRLKSGDVINIGKTQMLFLQDDPMVDLDIGQTDAFDPI